MEPGTRDLDRQTPNPSNAKPFKRRTLQTPNPSNAKHGTRQMEAGTWHPVEGT
ncbi:MAG: hypothetical protein HXX13_04420 [Bacteroidetes bacterium]|nr:hypothetical protein [Bacteroidota bacterium]